MDGSGARVTGILPQGTAPSVPDGAHPSPRHRRPEPEPTSLDERENGQHEVRVRAAVSAIPPVVPRQLHETDPHPRVLLEAYEADAADAPGGRDSYAVNARAAAQARSRKRGFLVRTLLVDVVVVITAVLLGYQARFYVGPLYEGEPLPSVPYVPIGAGVVVLWILALWQSRCYDERVVGYGGEEYRRVISGSLKIAGAVAIVAYLVNIPVARGFLGFAFVLGTVMLPVARWVARRQLHWQRRRGHGWSRRVLLVGDALHVVDLANRLRRERHAGFRVVGACIPDALIAPQAQHLNGVPVVGSFSTVVEAATAVSADTVAVTGTAELSGLRLRRLGWQMEGTGIDLVVAPSMTDVAGPRIHTQPVAGLPLIHISSPEFRGTRKWIKEAFDRVSALAGVVVLLPVFVVIALLIKLTSRGPVIFRQKRVGIHGTEFGVFKFRTMVVNAEQRLAELADQNDADGPLFKLQRDPRVTRVGRLLRRFSLDELPQLFNVLRGHMSVVGPRPPLPSEVAQYSQDMARRLLVKPGITGLWQVSGRSDLSWEETVRLDLYYV
ncbi:MAG TPA: sugar transferase, partial [Jiangellales bacterium]|nr:sugar transferase [Jiangellales bacterium]